MNDLSHADSEGVGGFCMLYVITKLFFDILGSLSILGMVWHTW